MVADVDFDIVTVTDDLEEIATGLRRFSASAATRGGGDQDGPDEHDREP
jgi:hypothetical protein